MPLRIISPMSERERASVKDKKKGRTKKMGGCMMMQRPGMKKGSIPPQLKKYVMAKKKKAKMKKKA